ncbi:hypothetical protein GQ600_9373 [Phytophthora cactorum]|nr:hypothetical protein GQ600_9373 [Phytophthora cactorum]
MATLRKKKKIRLQHMQDELQALETVLRLALESESLRTENTELHSKLQLHGRMASLAQEGLADSNGFQPQENRLGNVYEASERSPWTSRPCFTDSGWRVHFPHGEPSFHFQPFTRDHFDNVIKTCDSVLGQDPPYIKPVGTLFDTEANALSRAAEGPQNAVHWVREGGTFLTFTEVDDSAVDVSYDHWTSCEDERHGQMLFIQWAQYVCRWSERIVPSNLLQSGN